MANTYNTYKDSGIAWIGEIPSEWNVVHIKHYCEQIYSGGTPQSNNPDYWDGDIPWIPSGSCHDDVINEAPKSITIDGFENSSTKMIPQNTTVMAMTGATCANTGYVTFDTCMNQSVTAYIVGHNKTYSKYLFYLLQAAKEEILTKKTGGAQSGINVEDCKNIFVPYISFEVQKEISNVLDKKCGEIDALISLQEEMISELQVYKQSVITEAVTKGLNPNVKMKDSGVEWIGEIPEDWNVCKLKWLCSEIKDGSHFSPDIVDEGYPYVTAGDVHGKGINFSKTRKISEKDYVDLVNSGCKAEKNDVLIVKDGATTGRTGMVTDDTPCVLLSSVAMLRVNSKTDAVYLLYLLDSYILQHQIQMAMAGSAMPRITLTKLNKFLALEISVDEQQAIASYLDNKTQQIDSLIALKQEKILELKDYKKSIIYEYVTGKKRVQF